MFVFILYYCCYLLDICSSHLLLLLLFCPFCCRLFLQGGKHNRSTQVISSPANQNTITHFNECLGACFMFLCIHTEYTVFELSVQPLSLTPQAVTAIHSLLSRSQQHSSVLLSDLLNEAKGQTTYMLSQHALPSVHQH